MRLRIIKGLCWVQVFAMIGSFSLSIFTYIKYKKSSELVEKIHDLFLNSNYDDDQINAVLGNTVISTGVTARSVENSHLIILISIIMGCFFLLVLIFLIIYFFKTKKKQKLQTNNVKNERESSY